MIMFPWSLIICSVSFCFCVCVWFNVSCITISRACIGLTCKAQAWEDGAQFSFRKGNINTQIHSFEKDEVCIVIDSKTKTPVVVHVCVLCCCVSVFTPKSLFESKQICIHTNTHANTLKFLEISQK